MHTAARRAHPRVRQDGREPLAGAGRLRRSRFWHLIGCSAVDRDLGPRL